MNQRHRNLLYAYLSGISQQFYKGGKAFPLFILSSTAAGAIWAWAYDARQINADIETMLLQLEKEFKDGKFTTAQATPPASVLEA